MTVASNRKNSLKGAVDTAALFYIAGILQGTSAG